MARFILFFLIILAGCCLSRAVRGQDRVVVSVKHILDLARTRSIGDYTYDEQIRRAITEANDVLERNHCRWRLELEELVEVEGANPFFRIRSQEHLLELERTAMRDAKKFAWRSDAINIYIVDHLITAGTRGMSSLPMDLQDSTTDIIVLNNRGIRRGGIGWLHEIGHYLGLTHTFQQPYADQEGANRCTGVAAWHASVDGGMREVACADVCPDEFNVMSYNSFSVAEARLTDCQLDETNFELYDAAGKRGAVLRNSTPTLFVRGDANSDGKVNLADAVHLLTHLFASGPPPKCADSGDANDSGDLNIGDPIFLVSHLFSAGPTIPEPHGDCGADGTRDTLSCENFTPCADRG